MISYKDREGIRRLSQEYGMPESYVRQMLAIENGEITGDVIEVQAKPASNGHFRRFCNRNPFRDNPGPTRLATPGG